MCKQKLCDNAEPLSSSLWVVAPLVPWQEAQGRCDAGEGTAALWDRDYGGRLQQPRLEGCSGSLQGPWAEQSIPALSCGRGTALHHESVVSCASSKARSQSWACTQRGAGVPWSQSPCPLSSHTCQPGLACPARLGGCSLCSHSPRLIASPSRTAACQVLVLNPPRDDPEQDFWVAGQQDGFACAGGRPQLSRTTECKENRDLNAVSSWQWGGRPNAGETLS